MGTRSALGVRRLIFHLLTRKYSGTNSWPAGTSRPHSAVNRETLASKISSLKSSPGGGGGDARLY